MNTWLKAPLTALGALALSAAAGPGAQAQTTRVDPVAVETVRRAMDYLSGLDRFSAHVYNLREDIDETGHRIDLESSGEVIVDRPNRLRGIRHSDPVDETLIYDGERVTFYNDVDKTYMTAPAPATIEEMFLDVYQSVELYPVSDLIWKDAFPLMMTGVEVAKVVGAEEVGGVPCTHVLLGRPDLGIQIWIPQSGPPLPAKYVVADYSTAEKMAIVTYISRWNTDPVISDDLFTFAPPAGARELPFPAPYADDGMDR
jgi:hypothetical protein